ASVSLARMLNMLPVGMIAQAAAVASFPFLARLVAGGQALEADRLTTRSLRTTVAVSLGAGALVFAASRPVVRIVYQWGAFDQADSEVVAHLLSVLALSIPAWGIHQIIGRWFYAHRRMWMPVLIGTIATGVAIPLTWILAERNGAAGIAVASTIALWAYTAALALMWSRGVEGQGSGLLDALLRGLIPAALAAVAGRWVVERLPVNGWLVSVLTAIVTGVVVLIVYLGLARIFRFAEADPRTWMRRGSVTDRLIER
ncbi:MAG: lipid II flippase MurJ, partial [Acidimicrobiia bacterium]